MAPEEVLTPPEGLDNDQPPPREPRKIPWKPIGWGVMFALAFGGLFLQISSQSTDLNNRISEKAEGLNDKLNSESKEIRALVNQNTNKLDRLDERSAHIKEDIQRIDLKLDRLLGIPKKTER